jgi:alpha-L-rhamnosidase
MLLKETYPSWFYSINQGATTMWERWNSYSHEDGFGDAKMNSFNHYAYGAIGQWFYEGIAGIKALEPGYKKILIAPMPDARLTSASAEYDSTYGLISSSWQTMPTRLRIDVTIPPNTTATVVIPVDSGAELRLNGSDVSETPGVVMLDQNERNIVLQVIPGSYSFVTAKTGAH